MPVVRRFRGFRLRAQLERETDPGVKDTLDQHVSRLEQRQLWAQRAGDADLE